MSYCCRSSALSLCGILLLPVPRAFAALPLEMRSTSSRVGREELSFLQETDTLISLVGALDLRSDKFSVLEVTTSQAVCLPQVHCSADLQRMTSQFP